MRGIDMLTDKLINDSVVFFAGSGISYSSCLPSAEEILRNTCQKILPSLSEEQLKLISKGQPEVVYAVLLECSHQNTNCLDMWKCLFPQKWDEKYAPKANFEHCFIAAYSKRAKVPIFTVNYDTMFEDACEKLGMKEGWDYAVATECDQVDPSKDILYICKLHGDIGRIGDSIDPNTFKTTMTEITKKNKPWLDFLLRITEEKCICFVGYSGRDIDYYPFLKECLNNRPAPSAFWTLGGKIDIGWSNAVAIKSMEVIEKFPSDFFSDIYESVFSVSGRADEYRSRFNQCIKDALKSIRSTASISLSTQSSEKERFLAQIKSEIREVKLSQELFLMRFFQVHGKNKEAESIFEDQLAPCVSSFEEWEQQLILDTKMTLAREHARFIEYRKIAKEIRHITREKRKQTVGQELEIARGQELNAWVQIISSYQMEIPARLHFKLPLRLRGYGRLLVVKVAFSVLNRVIWFTGKSFRKANVVTVQESWLRSYAINVGLAEKLNRRDTPISRWYVNRVIVRLKKLWENAYEAGNYETVIGAMKYLARLCPKESFEADAEIFGKLVSNLSAISIIKRDNFKFNEEFQETLNEAKDNDNTLNIIKTYLKYASKRLEAEKEPFPCKEYAIELKDYMDKVESTHLQKCFAYIRKAYLQTGLS